MRILQISYADVFAGGEKMSLTLHQQFKKLGHESLLLVGSKRGDDPSIIEIPFENNSRLRRKIWYFLEKKTSLSKIFFFRQQRFQSFLKIVCLKPTGIIPFLSGVEYYDYPESRRILDLVQFKPDIIHCHSLRGYFDLRYLTVLSQNFPVVMTLHAPWAFTGQCNPPYDCEEWQRECKSCKYPSKFPHYGKNVSEINLSKKKKIYSETHIGLISPSKWLLDMAKNSVIAPSIFYERAIPNGVDTKKFIPEDINTIRSLLGLSLDIPIILFTAQGVKNNQTKDFPTLKKALHILSKKEKIQKFICLAIGGQPLEEVIGKVTLKIIAYQNDQNAIIKYFQAADIYVHPARSDNFPTTILEAMACGKPVIASNVSGIPEIVDPGVTGLLVISEDPQALADAMLDLLSDRKKREAMGIQARKKAVERFRIEKMVQDHIEFYHEVIHTYSKRSPNDITA